MRQTSVSTLVTAVCLAAKSRMVRFGVPAAVLLIGAAHGGDLDASKHNQRREYRVTDLATLGGLSRGNSINNLGWISGYSTTEEDVRRASLWLYGHQFDLGALGGPNARSSVVWPVKNDWGLIAGISQTDTPDPLEEAWSCAPFLGSSGPTCRAVVWEWGAIRALPTLGGYNSFAAGGNNLGQVTGWAENTVDDPTCHPESSQVRQFRPVVWGPGRDQIRELPLIADDASGAATAINDKGQAVGISGTCDQAVGRESAIHAVLWERNGTARDLGNIGAEYWNTPMAINRRGDVVVGFAGQEGDYNGDFTQPFIWTEKTGMEKLPLLEGDVSGSANAINGRGQIVGASCNAAGDCTAVMWENKVVLNLNDFRQNSYSGYLVTAQDINELGVITGRVFYEQIDQSLAYSAAPIRGHRGHAGGPVPKAALPERVKREIVQPMSPAHAKLVR